MPSAMRFVAFRTTRGLDFATTSPAGCAPEDARSFAGQTEPIPACVTPTGPKTNGTRIAAARVTRRTAAGYVSVFTVVCLGGLLSRPISPGPTSYPSPAVRGASLRSGWRGLNVSTPFLALPDSRLEDVIGTRP